MPLPSPTDPKMWSEFPPPPSPTDPDMCFTVDHADDTEHTNQPTQTSQANEMAAESIIFTPHFRTLEAAIDAGDIPRIPIEIANARNRYPHRQLGFDGIVTRAIKRGNVEVLRVLLDNGLSVGELDLEDAASRGDIAVLAYLMDRLSWPVNKTTRLGRTILKSAVEHEDLVSWLLSKGADPNVVDDWSDTPLCRAIDIGPDSVIRILLDAGSDVTLGAPLQKSIYRIKKGKSTIALTEELLSLGAPVNKYEGEHSSVWEWTGFERGTALHRAYRYRNLSAVRLLLAHGADPELRYRLHTDEIPESSALEIALRNQDTELVAILQGHLKSRDGTQKSNL